MRIVTEGISRSGMPSHTELAETDRRGVIEYIKTPFYPAVGGEPRKRAKRHNCLPEGSQPNVL